MTSSSPSTGTKLPPPDTYCHALQYGLELAKVHTLLVSHSHMDHWFPTDHDKREECLVYICKKDGKTIFYGRDTGVALSETAWALITAECYDLISLDATMGKIENAKAPNLPGGCSISTKPRTPELSGAKWITRDFPQ